MKNHLTKDNYLFTINNNIYDYKNALFLLKSMYNEDYSKISDNFKEYITEEDFKNQIYCPPEIFKLIENEQISLAIGLLEELKIPYTYSKNRRNSIQIVETYIYV